jgi:tRNA-splicing ligase RtcB
MKVFAENIRVPIKSWCSNPEIGAMEQAEHLANLPFVFKHISLMPDTHEGYGMPIGGIIATEGVVVPNAVGVDIGCGMCAVKTPWKIEEISKDQLRNIMGIIRKTVPVGFKHHANPLDISEMPIINSNPTINMEIVDREFENARTQIGTLGGGNHFIEIQADTEDNVWVMLHSGSRNIGLKVAKYYNDLAVSLNKQWHSAIPTKWELAFLPLDSDFGQQYLAEMKYCVDFALANRKLIMNRIADAFEDVIKWKRVNLLEEINIAHNYAIMENHFGRNVLIHRKGATLARKGTIGIIPGSMGSSSYIVEGLGNKDSFESCSHGAGRKMGRNEARRSLNLDGEIKILEDQGIIHGIRNIQDIDEATGAYKNIDEVMAEQSDLVNIIVKLRPLAGIKG